MRLFCSHWAGPEFDTSRQRNLTLAHAPNDGAASLNFESCKGTIVWHLRQPAVRNQVTIVRPTACYSMNVAQFTLVALYVTFQSKFNSTQGVIFSAAARITSSQKQFVQSRSRTSRSAILFSFGRFQMEGRRETIKVGNYPEIDWRAWKFDHGLNSRLISVKEC